MAVVAVTTGSIGIARVFRPVVERQPARLRGLTAPLRIVFACDLHYGPFVREPEVQAWVDAILAEAPDLVVLGGDLLDAAASPDRGPLLRALARLHAPLGQFAVWGNHDHAAIADLRPFARELRDVGVQVLTNQRVRPRRDLQLAGLDDLRRGRPDLPATLAGRSDDAATILVSHNPDVLPHVPADVGLTLAGHTHGGQICLPNGTPVVTSSRYGRRFAKGWVAGPARGYVSRGLGVSLVPIRLACPAELTVFDLGPATDAGQDTSGGVWSS